MLANSNLTITKDKDDKLTVTSTPSTTTTLSVTLIDQAKQITTTTPAQPGTTPPEVINTAPVVINDFRLDVLDTTEEKGVVSLIDKHIPYFQTLESKA